MGRTCPGGARLPSGVRIGILDRSRGDRANSATPSGGGFLTVANTGMTADRLVSVTSPAAGQVQIHEMKMDGTIMRMRELENGLEIPTGATVALAPGGLHLMLVGLQRPFEAGGSVPLVLEFRQAGSVRIALRVRSSSEP